MATSSPVGRPAGGRHRAAAVCTPGLETICQQELASLGLRAKGAGPGTVEFEATTRQLYAANVWLRTANRVLVRVASFRASSFSYLIQRAEEVDWGQWLADGAAPTFRVSTKRSKLYHTGAIAERLHQVVGEPLVGEQAWETDEQLFVVRVDHDLVTISADSSGQALHHRPWRTELGQAPLRPTMAAAMLLATGWDPTTGLLDPFCGSGTIPIEAALLARHLPPGGNRDFAFASWPSFEPGTWASVAGQVAAAARPPTGAPIRASDRDQAALAAATANAERAGILDDLAIEPRVVSHLTALGGTGLVATNPPYGKRVPGGNLERLYRRFGAVVNQRLGGWGLAIVSADRQLARATDRRLKPLARFGHGGLPVELLYRPPPQDTAAKPAERARAAKAKPAKARAKRPQRASTTSVPSDPSSAKPSAVSDHESTSAKAASSPDS